MLSTRWRQVDRRMAREAIAVRADLYWANDVRTLRPAAAAARVTGARFVYDAHDLYWDAPTITPVQRRLWGLVERTHIRRAERVFTVCDPIADELQKRYGIARPTVVLNCPRLSWSDRASAREDGLVEMARRPGERIVLFHGSLSPWRGLEQLIAAIGILPDEFRLFILGHGAFRTTLETLAADLGLADRVTFRHSVPPDQLASWLSAADVGTIPYQRRGLNHEYSTPNKLFEYIHVGLPVVVNDLPEIRRVVEEVGFGLVCDCSTPEPIAKAILDLTADPIRYEEMRARALAAASRYSWDQQEMKILGALER